MLENGDNERPEAPQMRLLKPWLGTMILDHQRITGLRMQHQMFQVAIFATEEYKSLQLNEEHGIKSITAMRNNNVKWFWKPEENMK
jgi:hypothetical protein